MEFLDEREKRKQAIKLFTGYILIAIIIGLASLILVYLAQGYNYNPDEGVTRNGLVFISSKPVAAAITLDNKTKGTTDLRVALPEGEHSITLKKDKYRDWNKQFSLDGGHVLYFLYPRIFPVDIPVGVTRVFPTTPVWASQSPDRRWLVIQLDNNAPILNILDLSKPDIEPKMYMIPANQLSVQNGQYGIIKPLEWSSDNRRLLLSQTMPDGKIFYVLFDRQNTDETVNLSEQLQLKPTQKITLRDKKFDKYYVHDIATGELRSAELKKGFDETPIVASGVVTYKSHGDDLLAYVTYDDQSPTVAKLFILKDQTDRYQLQNMVRNPQNKYLLDMAKYDNIWYYVASSHTSNKACIYSNPLNRDKPNNTKPITPQMSFKMDNPQYVSFSENTRFIAIQSGKNFIVLDSEQNRVYKYASPLNIQSTQKIKWMDGHRLAAVTDSQVHVFEFDGTNQQTLISSRPEFTAYFDRDYEYIFTLIALADGKTALENGKLVVEEN